METKGKIVLGEGSFNGTSVDVAIVYQKFGRESISERFIDIYDGDLMIFVSRDADPSEPRTYVLTECDVKTGKTKVYKVELKEVRDMKPEEIELIKLEKKAMLEEQK